LESNTIFDGEIRVPVLTMHSKGDGLAFLRQTFVHRAGHCALTPAETIAAVQALLRRMDTGFGADWMPTLGTPLLPPPDRPSTSSSHHSELCSHHPLILNLHLARIFGPSTR